MASKRNLVLRPTRGIEQHADEQFVARLLPLTTGLSDMVSENCTEGSGTSPSPHSSPDSTSTPCHVRQGESVMVLESSVEISVPAPSADSSPDSISIPRRVRREALPSFCQNSIEISETASSADSSPDPTSTPCSVRHEALPHFCQNNTLVATMNIWSRHNDEVRSASLDKPTNDILDSISNGHLPPSPITKVKLQLVVDLGEEHRVEVSLDFTQWHDFDSAVRIEQVAPTEDKQHEDIFLPDIQAAMEMMFEEVGPLDGKPNDCERVLSVVETAVDDVFFRRNYWLETASPETLEGLARKH